MIGKFSIIKAVYKKALNAQEILGLQLKEMVFLLARVRTPLFFNRRQTALPPAVRTGESSANDQGWDSSLKKVMQGILRRAQAVRQAESKEICFLKLCFTFLPSTKWNANGFCSANKTVNFIYIGNSNIFIRIKASRKNSPSGWVPLWDKWAQYERYDTSSGIFIIQDRIKNEFQRTCAVCY